MRNLFTVLGLFVLATLPHPFATAHAQGTAFTYQGRLNDGVNPATGSYDLRFGIYSAAAGGTAYGTLTNAAIGITNGLFTVTLDFGSVFVGTSYWLEIGVRTNGTGAFTTLTQRQPVTPTPYAVYAGTASNLVGSVTIAQLPASVVTNGASGANLAGTFTGDGGNLTNVNASALHGLNSTNFWQLGGNTVQSNVDFIGSVNNAPLDLKVNGNRALRLEPTALGAPNIIGGSRFNEVQHSALYGDPYSATVAGGGDYRVPNIVSAPFATVGGGVQNTASGEGAVVSGGGADGSNWGGNTAGGPASVVAGGFRNQVTGSYSTVGGGANNAVSGLFSTIPGGDYNEAAGDYSFAAGYRAKAITHGTFVWGDLQDADFASTANNQFLIRARNGVGIGTNNPHAALQVVGTVLATDFEGTFHGTYDGDFSGNGAGLTNLNAASLGGQPAGNFWQLGGNNVSAGQFIGSTNAQPVEIWVNNQRAIRLEQVTNLNDDESFNIIGGYAGNTVAPGVTGATISGGGGSHLLFGAHTNNQIGADFSTIGGGDGNQIQTLAAGATIGGGEVNAIETNAFDSTIAGGRANQVGNNSLYAAIGGGVQNQVLAQGGTIAGGQQNLILTNAYNSTISGGFRNLIQSHINSSVIVGGQNNQIHDGAEGSTIAGGEYNTIATNASFATIVGGWHNLASSYGSTAMGYSTIASGAVATAMGTNTTASGFAATAMGGDNNATGDYSTAMGSRSTASGPVATAMGLHSTASGISSIAMGNSTASGDYSTAMGTSEAKQVNSTALGHSTASEVNSTALGFSLASGYNSTALGFSVATGTNSTATGNSYASGEVSTALGCSTASGDFATAIGFSQATNTGSLVWGDRSSFNPLTSTNDNSLTFRAAGGYRLFTDTNMTAGVSLASGSTAWATISDQNAKKNFVPVNGQTVLAKLAAVPVQQWNYKWEKDTDVPNIGPMAQAFKKAFYPGRDDKSITTLEFDGVELAAIQGLNQKLEEQKAENAELKQQLNELKTLVKQLAQQK